MAAITATQQRLGWMAIPVDSPVFQANDSKLKDLYLFLKRRSRRFLKKLLWGKDALTLEPGDFIFGRNAVAQDLGLNPSTVRDKLYKLRDLGLVERIFSRGGKKGFSVWRFLDVIQPKEKAPTQDKLARQPQGDATNPPEGLKKKINHHIAKTPDTWLTPGQMVVSNPIIQKADKTGAFDRFKASSEDFLQWLIGKATEVAKNPQNPIPLVIHWLQTGKQNSAYADVQKQRESCQLRKAMAEAKKAALEKQREKENAILADEARLLRKRLGQDPNLKTQLISLIEQPPKYVRPFIRNKSTEEILEDPMLISLVANYLEGMSCHK